MAQEWTAARRRTRGGQQRYSDLAIEICLTLRVVFRPALRQTLGFMRSIAKLMGLALPVPDFSTLSRRGKSLTVTRNGRAADRPITLIVDSTGLKIHSDTDWHGHKHGVKGARKTWRKLHLALDPDSGVIHASELTIEHVGDETALPDPLANIDARVDRFVADGVYDGTGVSDCVVAAFGSKVDIIRPQRTPFLVTIQSATAMSSRSPRAVEWLCRSQPATIKDHASKLKSVAGKRSSVTDCKAGISTIKPAKPSS